MFWLLILMITALTCLVAFETAFIFVLGGEYSAISGMLRDANQKMVEHRSIDPRRFERQNGLVEQTVPDFNGDDLY